MTYIHLKLSTIQSFAITTVLLYISVIIGIPKTSTAQNTGLENPDEVIVVAPYNPNIHPAKALPEWPNKDMSHIQAIPMPYAHTAQASLEAVPVQNIKAMQYKLPKQTNIYHNFAKLGYSTANTPYAELFLNHPVNDINIGLYAKHLSSSPTIEDAAKANYANTAARIFVEWGQREWQSTLSANFARRMQHYYGFNTNNYPIFTSADNDSLQQWYAEGGLAWNGYFINDNDGKWEADAAYQFFKTHTEGKEHLLKANIAYKQALQTNDDNQQYWGAKVKTQTHGTSIYNTTTTHGTYQITPYYLWQSSQWIMCVGAHLIFGKDSTSYFTAAPSINFAYHVPEVGLQIYAQADGQVQANSLRSLSYENPYISPYINLLHTQEPLNLKAGVRGNFLDNHFYYDCSVGYTKQKNTPLFVIDTTTYFQNAFQAVSGICTISLYSIITHPKTKTELGTNLACNSVRAYTIIGNNGALV